MARFLIVVFGLASGVMRGAADDGKQAVGDFGIGQGLGQCVAAGCQVFRGFLADDSFRSGQPVAVRVEEWLLGAPIRPPETIAVPYEDHVRNGDGGGVPALAWEGVKLSKNLPVTVVFGVKRGWGVQAGNPVVVASGDGETALIRSLTREALRLEESPGAVSDHVASLSRAANPGLAGYVFAFLTRSEKVTRRGLAADLLTEMFGSPSVPPELWKEMPFWMVMASGSLPREGQARMARRFVEMAQQRDPDAALAGFAGLALIASPGAPMREMIQPAAFGGLSRAYTGLLRAGKMRSDQSLEVLLGIRQE